MSFGRQPLEIFPDLVQGLFVADDTLIIIALPHRNTGRTAMFVYPPGGKCFKRTDNFRQRMRFGSGKFYIGHRGGFETRTYKWSPSPSPHLLFYRLKALFRLFLRRGDFQYQPQALRGLWQYPRAVIYRRDLVQGADVVGV